MDGSAAPDAGPLVALAKLGLLHLLPDLFTSVLVPWSVCQKTGGWFASGERPDADALRATILTGRRQIVDVSATELPAARLALPIHTGEPHTKYIAQREQTEVVLLMN